ncbi:unnamed protein product [Protopolystoma xenopodis]|uniref:Uncharacterized protein n=1 Tax=Protopolystoma xenopodis TaxID=117903 RepID=A0A448WEN3_9PLAT|nr:unnamed protein product [Protopolystoma xenopodis]
MTAQRRTCGAGVRISEAFLFSSPGRPSRGSLSSACLIRSPSAILGSGSVPSRRNLAADHLGLQKRVGLSCFSRADRTPPCQKYGSKDKDILGSRESMCKIGKENEAISKPCSNTLEPTKQGGFSRRSCGAAKRHAPSHPENPLIKRQRPISVFTALKVSFKVIGRSLP